MCTCPTGKRCRVKADLSPACLQNGRGSVPLFLELRISAEVAQLRYELGRAPQGPNAGSKPDVERAWQEQLGFVKLDKLKERAHRMTRIRILRTALGTGASQKTSHRFRPSDPLFEHRSGNYFNPAHCLNVRPLRRLMGVMGMWPLGNVQRFLELLLLLCGADYSSLAARLGQRTVEVEPDFWF
ncbi:hypothetical protein PAPYR_7915 [Paratrimastix pyriformis]|uniref:Uncharacterized protein n=1 Tax=Paratrimastix pyriformis TaxID=342808 RepID=A0ABQ8UH87_9EUKA|nr:hypothetical protein PAPYR_7915 [Paratrimastix pyriformis]